MCCFETEWVSGSTRVKAVSGVVEADSAKIVSQDPCQGPTRFTYGKVFAAARSTHGGGRQSNVSAFDRELEQGKDSKAW